MIVWDKREVVGDWVRQRIKYVNSWGEWYQAIGFARNGELVGGVVYNLYSGHDIAIHVASDGTRRWVNRENLRATFGYPFCQLKVNRLTGYVPAKNADARRFDEHLGFIYEGTLREALPDDDIAVYGMLRRECRFI